MIYYLKFDRSTMKLTNTDTGVNWQEILMAVSVLIFQRSSMY